MARRDAVNTCLICNGECVCSAKKLKKPRDRMKAAAAKEPQVVVKQDLPPASRRHIKLDPEVLLLNEAIRSLDAILHPDERLKHQAILKGKPTLNERQLVWRYRLEKNRGLAS